MKPIYLIPLLLIASKLNASCSTEEALNGLRPGAEWSIQDHSYGKLQWLDKSQSKPTAKEVADAIAACQQGEASDKTAKDQAKIDLNTKSKTDTQRIDAIIKYLNLDK